MAGELSFLKNIRTQELSFPVMSMTLTYDICLNWTPCCACILMIYCFCRIARLNVVMCGINVVLVNDKFFLLLRLLFIRALTCRPTAYISDQSLLFQPRVKTSIGSRSYSTSAPVVWNAIPLSIRSSHTIATFKNNLKTFYFGTTLPRPPA